MPAKPALRTELLFYLSFLVAAADAVADGDLGRRAPDAETRDFATLAERLNRMTDHLLDAQGQLVRSEKLASIGRLAAGIAHEVGNPLGAIGTYVEVLRRRGADPEVISGVTRELDRLDRIVRGLLDYARPQEESLAPGRLRRRRAGGAPVRSGLGARGTPRGSREGLRPVLHHQGAGPRDRLGSRHRSACGARHGWCGVGGHGAGGRGGIQDVLPCGMTRVLVVDDEPGLRQSLGLLLADAGYDVAAAGTGTRALERALAESLDLVLCDVRMPEMDGLAFLRAYKGGGGTGLVIMMSAYGGEEAALAAMKEGAYDYVPKPFRPDEVVLTLRKAEERERLTHTIATLRAQLDSSPGTRALIAESPAMRQALEIVARVAGHPTTVLITGERGTGKEVIAQAIHRASPRAAGPFVAVNCAAIPDTLLESELFGYVKGAFTGAAGDRPGLFEQADGGTLLLDEVGELPLALQAKLLRVLQENEIRRVGDQKTRRVDVRLLAATAKDLAAEAATGRFRHDLFDRLNVVAIHLSPLSERRADIAPLARHFAARLAGRLGRRVTLSDAALEWLGEQLWPGNVRSLEHAIERAAVLSDKEILEAGDFVGPRPLSPAPQRGEGDRGGEVTLRDAVERAERDAITAALRGAGGNRREAAKRLGVSLRTLFYKMDRYRID